MGAASEYSPEKISAFVRILAAALLVLSVSEIYRLYVSGGEGSSISRLAFFALGAAFLPYFTLREIVMTSLAGLLTFGIWAAGDTSAIFHALDRAAFFAAFIYLVTLLKEAAQRSRSVMELGTYLTRQPQGRRYYSISIGGHALGVLLNFGAISLLVPLIKRGAQSVADSRRHGEMTEAQLEQQQISALLRGFSWMILWSPTALTQAVLFTSFPDAKASVVIPLGIVASVVMILIGRALDRVYWRHVARSQQGEAPPVPRNAVIRFGLVCAFLVGATFAVVVVADVPAAIALMLVAPIVTLFWIHAQQAKCETQTATKNTLMVTKDILTGTARHSAQSAYVLGIAGYIGIAAAALAPVGELAGYLSENPVAGWVFLAALPLVITIGGQLALSPILVVVFLAAVINELPVLPADPSHIVFALGAGWALSMTASPNASATLLISSITQVAPTTLTWRWNGLYALICFVALVVSFVLLASSN